jgi:methylglutaconyl-CoA hydratase
MGERVRCEIEARGVARVTLDRADRHNAFDDIVIRELTAELERLGADARVRAIVLTGAGRSFSAGADIGWMRGMAAASEQANREDALALAKLMRTLDGLAKPTVARVNGPAYGGGVGLVACCDIAIASSDARFAFTEVRLGLAPAVISPYVIAAIGTRQARRLFATGETFDAERALAIGLVHGVVAPDMLDSGVEAVLVQLLLGGPAAQGEIKKLVAMVARDAGAPDLEARTADLIARLRASSEGQEGLGAFLGKREPGWRR